MKKIIWEKWADPMGLHSEDDFVGENEYENSYEQYEAEKEGGVNYKAKPAALTAFGIIPINYYNNPEKAFNFWVGHTNFNLGYKSCTIINTTPGVEIFDIFSPYRFRISIGKAFTFTEVKKNLEARLLIDNQKMSFNSLDLNIDDTLKAKIANKIEQLQKDSKYWLIYVAPNGEFEMSAPKDLNSFQIKKGIFSRTYELAGGLFFSSDVFGV